MGSVVKGSRGDLKPARPTNPACAEAFAVTTGHLGDKLSHRALTLVGLGEVVEPLAERHAEDDRAAIAIEDAANDALFT